ncbi:MAG: glycosyltransferase family 4 protein [Vicinamibacteria bacterium]|jgi:glycosyltransferase involved in cell wall biosynthesis|nr:glycosyltransferase family 4 protein [Vicinamibacteria bacterium]
MAGPESKRPQLAVVVQRYGVDITGGSESLARAVAERLQSDFDVTVLTSCARDYVTWRNELPAGEAQENGVRVLRFAVDEERDLEAFNAMAEPLYGRDLDETAEHLWLRRQGPYVPRLIEHLAAHKDEFDAILFFTYLYYPTYWGLKAAPERSVLIPTAHDEPPLAFRIYKEVFALPRAFAFCSAPEEAMVLARFAIHDRPHVVAGMGVAVPAHPDTEGFRIRHDVSGPYALYAGRIDAGKGCAEMLAHYRRYREDCRGAAELLLIGKLAMAPPRQPGVRYLGYLSEEEKAAAMAGAVAVICPSRYESLSIVLLEGLALGAPALVNAHSDVLIDHCRQSRAGLYYETAGEFVEALDLLVHTPALRRALGASGRRYVAERYEWTSVMARYRAMIDHVRRR